MRVCQFQLQFQVGEAYDRPVQEGCVEHLEGHAQRGNGHARQFQHVAAGSAGGERAKRLT